ncbi:MAG: FAD-dependent oxidoreductase [Actinomycetota bacterium]|nr:FAD-dependent oxidoreductase [Actinomycetota bacterium]
MGTAKKIVIVGGVAGGMSAATRLRRLMEDAEIIVLERSGYVSFANCGLPYHVGGVIEAREQLLLQTPQSLGARFALDVRVRHEAIKIDTSTREIEIRNLADGTTYRESYDALVLSPGARPVRPPIPGIERALTLRDIEDTDAMIAALGGTGGTSGTGGRPVETAAIIGGGFIGLELAENLVRRGLKVTLIEATDQVMAPLDPEMVGPIHDRLREHGIDLVLGVGVTEIGADSVTLADGRVKPADVVAASIGVRPESSLAAEAGLTLGLGGGIAVDDHLRTSDPHIYAVGDAVVKRDADDDSEVLVPLANTANRQGRLVADIIAGRPSPTRPVLGTAIVGLFGLVAATTGWNEKRLRKAGRPYRAIHIHPGSHAGYYPGSSTMSLKLLLDPATDAILGAQGVGEDGVDKRIDVIATAMSAGLTATDLADLELAYAPQFGSAKDAVNMLGFVAENMRDGLIETVQWSELADELKAGAALIDVRTPREFAAGAIPGSRNIPVDDLRARCDELPDGPIVVTCAVGQRGNTASRIISQLGRSVKNLDGGYRTWAASPAARG